MVYNVPVKNDLVIIKICELCQQCWFFKNGKNYASSLKLCQNYASTIYESVGEGGGGHNFGAFDGLIIGILRYFNQSSCSVDDTGE